MILKELLNTIDKDSYVLLECYEPTFSNNDNRAFGFYADYITSVDPDADREVITYDLTDEEEAKIRECIDKNYLVEGDLRRQTALDIKRLTELGYDKMPICMAKTQYSFTDDQTKLGAPTGFTVTVRNIKVSAGAGFLVALTGDIMTMPGLPKVPSAEKIDVDENGKITGLF